MDLVLIPDDPTDEQLDEFTKLIGETPFMDHTLTIRAPGYWRIERLELRSDGRYDATIQRLGEGLSSTNFPTIGEFTEAVRNFIPTVVNVVQTTGRLRVDQFIVC